MVITSAAGQVALVVKAPSPATLHHQPPVGPCVSLEVSWYHAQNAGLLGWSVSMLAMQTEAAATALISVGVFGDSA